jgi:hypothetical protein
MNGSASIPSFGHNERNALGHEIGDEGDVSGETIELRHDDGTFGRPCCCQRGSKLGSPIEGVRSLAGLDFGELGDARQILGFGEACNRRSLGLDAKS